MKKTSSAGRESQVESRRSNVERPASQDARRKTTKNPATRAAAGGGLRPAADSAAVALDLPVPEALLAKLRLASPSGDPAAAALSFLLDRFKQPIRRPRT